MNTIKTASQTYVPKTAKNITELKSVDINLTLQVESGVSNDGEEYTYNYFEINGEKYRVPDSVLASIKAILEVKPSLKTVAVTKKGEGRLTKYTVIPLD